jgi:hypothetical protein
MAVGLAVEFGNLQADFDKRWHLAINPAIKY